MSNEDNDTCALGDEEAAMEALADDVARRSGLTRPDGQDGYTFVTLAVDRLVSVASAAKVSLKHCEAERDEARREVEDRRAKAMAKEAARILAGPDDIDAARREAESAKALQAEAERDAAAWRERFTTAETVGRHEWGAVAKALNLDPATLTAGEVVEAIRARVVTKAAAVLREHPGYRKVDAQVTAIIDNMSNALALSGRAIEAAADALAVMNGGKRKS